MIINLCVRTVVTSKILIFTNLSYYMIDRLLLIAKNELTVTYFTGINPSAFPLHYFRFKTLTCEGNFGRTHTRTRTRLIRLSEVLDH